VKKQQLGIHSYLKQMDRDSANATRLRINRIALIQQIDPQELIPKLIRARIISPDHDVHYIYQGTSKIDRARRLIDCLLDKDTEDINRPGNWFLLFRSILLENPSAYEKLVIILDNTIIPIPDYLKPTSQISSGQFNVSSVNTEQDSSNHYQKQVTNIEFDRYAMNKVLIEGSFQKILDNLPYHSQVCSTFLFISN
jgi:hypothetical protein